MEGERCGDNIMKAGVILEGDFWREPVRILTVQRLGSCTKIEAVGTKTQQFYSHILNAEDLARVSMATETGRGRR